MAEILDQIYRSKTVSDEQGNTYPLRANIDPLEGRFIADLIARHPAIKSTAEVGCAYGLSSLHICEAIQGRAGAHHVIVDPFQNTNWKGIGVSNLRRSGIDFFELIEEGSEFALPRLAKERRGTFDFVFIDGWHTFDHTLIDLFYANLMIKVGGIIVIDDCSKPAVAKAVTYVSRYPAYEVLAQSDRSWRGRLASSVVTAVPRSVLGSVVPHIVYDRLVSKRKYATMVALHKVAEDERDWNWFASF
ncbi:MAG: class I SAM-dependent methyltransferase [Pseudomonadota bacterium]|nr:class I SAM-dependent methyltransferase [Pseudomonadota bacterium]